MNPRTKRVLAAVVLVAALAAILWARMPRTFDQAMGHGFDRTRGVRMEAYVTALSGQGETRRVELSPQDPAYEDLLALLDSQEYQRGRHHEGGQQMLLGHYAHICFILQEEEGWSGWCLYLMGSENMQFLPGYGGDSRPFTSSGGLDFQQEVLDLLLAQPYTLNQ